LNPFASPGQHIVGHRRRLRRSLRPLLRHQRGLQGTNCPVERQTMRLQRLRRDATAIPDDRSQDNGAIDIAPPASASRRGSSF
jgi:hypothetical protein